MSTRPSIDMPCQDIRARAFRRRICVLTEDASGAPDEGIKRFALYVAASLEGRHAVTLVSTRGPACNRRMRIAPTNRMFLGGSLRSVVRACDPEIVLYVARTSTTLMSFLRARVLKHYCPTARLVLIGLQPRRHSWWQRQLIRRLRPDLILVQSVSHQAYLERLGCAVGLVPSGVDTSVFRPVSPEERDKLRTEYGLRLDMPIVLHVGHLKLGRGISVLAELAASRACQVVLAASSSTRQDDGLASDLRSAGVTVLTDYLPRIEHLYQLADCYVFPVQTTDHAIGIPLSVLEALACDLPVVSSRFGGLPRSFDRDDPGLVFVDAAQDIVPAVLAMCRAPRCTTRPLVAGFTWDAVATSLLNHLDLDPLGMSHV